MRARPCCGLTRAGRPCSLTSASTLTDERGRSVASPLRRGGDRCRFHSRPFVSHPAACPIGPLEILFLDLETTGVDLPSARVIEFSAVQALSHGPGACYSTVVSVDPQLLLTQSAKEASAAHCISNAEILRGPSFPECWKRFLSFAEGLLEQRIEEMSDSSDEPTSTRPAEEQATLLVAAHNGFAFDMAVLLFECHRHKLDLGVFERWLYVDTLHLAQAGRASWAHATSSSA